MKFDDVLAIYNNRVELNRQELTVFILTFNREKYLYLAIEGILNQTYRNFSLIIMDNYSKDGTEKMVRSFRDDRILYIKRVSDLSTSDSNMRFAFEICRTEYMIVFHDDDTIERQFIEKALEEIKNTGCDALSVGGKIIDENGDYTGRTFSSHPKMLFEKDEYFSFFFSHNADSMLYPSVIYKRSFFKEYKEFITVMKVGPCNDQYLWFQIGRYGGSICIDNLNLMNYRVHSGQDSQQNFGFIDFEFLDALEKDVYYSNLIRKNRRKIQIRIFGIYCKLCSNFLNGKINKERYDSVFCFACIKNLRKNVMGMFIYALMRIFQSCPFIAKLYLRLIA